MRTSSVHPPSALPQSPNPNPNQDNLIPPLWCTSIYPSLVLLPAQSSVREQEKEDFFCFPFARVLHWGCKTVLPWSSTEYAECHPGSASGHNGHLHIIMLLSAVGSFKWLQDQSLNLYNISNQKSPAVRHCCNQRRPRKVDLVSYYVCVCVFTLYIIYIFRPLTLSFSFI